MTSRDKGKCRETCWGKFRVQVGDDSDGGIEGDVEMLALYLEQNVRQEKLIQPAD